MKAPINPFNVQLDLTFVSCNKLCPYVGFGSSIKHMKCNFMSIILLGQTKYGNSGRGKFEFYIAAPHTHTEIYEEEREKIRKTINIRILFIDSLRFESTPIIDVRTRNIKFNKKKNENEMRKPSGKCNSSHLALFFILTSMLSREVGCARLVCHRVFYVVSLFVC